jgi:hypothetical protein
VAAAAIQPPVHVDPRSLLAAPVGLEVVRRGGSGARREKRRMETAPSAARLELNETCRRRNRESGVGGVSAARTARPILIAASSDRSGGLRSSALFSERAADQKYLKLVML